MGLKQKIKNDLNTCKLKLRKRGLTNQKNIRQILHFKIVLILCLYPAQKV